MGGAGFPANVKLSPKNEDAIDYIIVNGAECEPYLTSDYRRMMEEPDKLILGLEICINLFDHAKGIIAIEDNKPEAIELLRDKVKDNDKIEVHVMKTKYPQGAERQLIYANTGRYVNSKMLPADAGCIVHNVDTIVSIYELNRKELEASADLTSELIVYGRLPMMVSAQCICKNTIGCKKQPVELTLVDRMRNRFPVKNNCRECYNVIYNSLPLSLADQWSSVRTLSLRSVRLSFTTETQTQMPLDVEFAIDEDNTVTIFQMRPLAASINGVHSDVSHVLHHFDLSHRCVADVGRGQQLEVVCHRRWYCGSCGGAGGGQSGVAGELRRRAHTRLAG